MAILPTQINPNSPAYQENLAKMNALRQELAGHMQDSLFQGKEKYLERAHKAGKYLARERIEKVLDPDSPFLELLPLAGLGRKGGFSTGGTTVGGIGLVQGKLTMLMANVGTDKGGATDYPTLQKNLRLSEIAMENRLPVIALVESGGANLPDQARVFNLGGNIFKEISRRSKAGLTTISVVFGNSTAGGAYLPGMSDYAIFVKGNAKVFLAGPPLVKMATNEIADEEELGGAEMHSRTSGVSDYLAETEDHGLLLARELMKFVEVHPQPHHHPSSSNPSIPQSSNPCLPPRYPVDELSGIVSADLSIPFDAREVIARIVDDSDFHEFKPDYGTTLVTGYAHIHGYPLGIIANNGVLFSDSSNKGAHFIQLCNHHKLPILFLQNITGFMVGKKYEQEGIIKHGAKMINAVSNSEVPLITIMLGASYGAGNYAMAGRAYNPRFLFSYPNTRIAVMGSEQLVGVMEIITRAKLEKSGVQIDEKQAAMQKAMVKKQLDDQSTAWYSTGNLWDDGIIDPPETRNYLAMCLATVYNAPFEGSKEYGIFRM